MARRKSEAMAILRRKKLFWVQIKWRRLRAVHVKVKKLKVKKLRRAPRMTLRSLRREMKSAPDHCWNAYNFSNRQKAQKIRRRRKKLWDTPGIQTTRMTSGR